MDEAKKIPVSDEELSKISGRDKFDDIIPVNEYDYDPLTLHVAEPPKKAFPLTSTYIPPAQG